MLSGQSTGKDMSLSAGVDSAGTYYAVVMSDDAAGGWNYDGGSYSLTATRSSSTASVETESNDTLAQADVLSDGTPLTGQLSSATDLDVYRRGGTRPN